MVGEEGHPEVEKVIVVPCVDLAVGEAAEVGVVVSIFPVVGVPDCTGVGKRLQLLKNSRAIVQNNAMTPREDRLTCNNRRCRIGECFCLLDSRDRTFIINWQETPTLRSGEECQSPFLRLAPYGEPLLMRAAQLHKERKLQDIFFAREPGR